jgi:hypothetical protein
MSFHFISSPYSGTDEEREERAHITAQVCGKLLRRDFHVISPAVHSHTIIKAVDFTAEERRSLILDFGLSLLRKASGMIVLEIEGWEKSFGVQAEIALCRELNIPVRYLNPAELTDTADPKRILKDHPYKSHCHIPGAKSSDQEKTPL